MRTWLAATLLALLAQPARADPPRVRAVYNLDVVSVDGRGAQVLDKLIVKGDADVAAGLHAHASLLNVSGDQPNQRAGTLQGVDNIEVSRHRLRLFDAWLEQDLGAGASVRVGLQDYNEEFYATDTTDLLISPTFGIGAEVGASGVNGPSIFPSTALSARLKLQPAKDVYIQVAAFDAKAGSLGDPGGIDTGFREGLLLAGEAGWTGRGHLAVGAWRYSRRQRLNPPAGDPTARGRSQGAYVLIEEPLGAEKGPLTAFLRAGLSDTDALPLSAAGEAGLKLAPVVHGRPDSAFVVGLAAARAGARTQRAVAAAGEAPAGAETLVEASYSDRIAPHLTVQPDLQLVRHAGARAGEDEAVFILRLTADF
jgi:porin